MSTQADTILAQPDEAISDQAASAPALSGETHAAPESAGGRARLYTAEELLQLSQDRAHRYELVQGKLHKMSPAGSKHGVLAARLLSRIQLFVDEHNLGLAFAAETGFRLASNPDTVRAPDASFVSLARIPAEGIPNSYFPTAPDLAVEIVSPHDTASGVQDKVQSWLAHGTQLVWVVEPKTQTVTIYRPDGSAQVLQHTDTLDGETALPEFRFALAQLFRKPKSEQVKDT